VPATIAYCRLFSEQKIFAQRFKTWADPSVLDGIMLLCPGRTAQIRAGTK